MHVGQPQIRVRLDTAAREDHRFRSGQWIGEPGVQNQQVALRDAVDAQRLIVQVRLVPVVEDAVPTAQGRPTTLRVPGQPEPRHDVHLVADV